MRSAFDSDSVGTGFDVASMLLGCAAGAFFAGRLAQWLANFGITMTFPIMLVGIGLAGAYSFYALSALVSIYFVVHYVHETKGLELEEMV